MDRDKDKATQIQTLNLSKYIIYYEFYKIKDQIHNEKKTLYNKKLPHSAALTMAL